MRDFTSAVFNGLPDKILSASVNSRGHVWLHEVTTDKLHYNITIGAWIDANGDYGTPKGSDYADGAIVAINRVWL